jgi:DNA-binding IclR family transcriptional regulator
VTGPEDADDDDAAGSPATATPPYLVQSADHALRLLRAVVDRKALRVSDAAQLLGVVPSTAHRLLATLSHQGFVIQQRKGGAYIPGPTVTELALASAQALDLHSVAGPVLERLRDATQETVSLLVLEGAKVRFIDSIDGPRTVRVASRLGVTLPAHCTSGGKALLALLTRDELLGTYPKEDLPTWSPRSLSSRDRLEVELADVRRRGYATNFDEGDTGIGGVGRAVRDAAGGPLVAVTVAAPIARLNTRKAAAALCEPLRAASEEMEAALTARQWPRPS